MLLFIFQKYKIQNTKYKILNIVSQTFLSILFGLALIGVIIFQPNLMKNKENRPEPPAPQNHTGSVIGNLSFDVQLPELVNPPYLNSPYLAAENNPKFYPIRNWDTPAIELQAKAAVAADLASERIFYQKNINDPLPIASLTKLMTTLIVLENYNLDGLIKISKTAIETEGDKGGLVVDEELSARELLKIMLIESSNDAATALAEKNGELGVQKFVEMMNQKAQTLAMNQTKFKDPAGLNGGNISSVSDLLKLVKHLFSLWPGIAEITRTSTLTVFSADGKISHQLKNTNLLLEKNPEIIAGKTGYSNEANGCLLILTKINPSSSLKISEENKIITIVLGSSDRFGETEQLINWLKTAYIWK